MQATLQCQLDSTFRMNQFPIGRDFSKSHLKGKNFATSNLHGTNFSNSRTSLSEFWAVLSFLASFLLSYLSGFASAQGSSLVFLTFEIEKFTLTKLLTGLVIVFVSLLSLYLVIRRGFASGIGITVLILIFSLLICLILTRESTPVGMILFIGVGNIALLLVGLIAASLSTITMISLMQAKSIAVIGNLVVSSFTAAISTDTRAIFAASIVSLSGSYAAIQSLRKNKNFFWIRDVAISFIAMGGVSFRQAVLVEANFSGATLKYTDFRDADLTRAYLHNAQGLEFARLGNTYLANSKIRQLVVTCNGRGQNFDGLDLTGVNLQGANLQDASFVGANLNLSNLRDADLSRAILKQTQLDSADLTGAILTGACIEDWGMTSTTKLENVQCEFVFMRMQTKENQNPLRKPDNWQETFAAGEFADFIQPYFDTLDLYHSQDVDPRAISIAFKKLSQNHPDANLEIVAMEKRGQSSFNLKVRTATTADKSELSSEYFADYNQLKALSEARLLLLAEKDDRIHSLELMIQTALHQPTFNVETIQGDFMPENKGISISAGNNANISGVSSGDGIVNLGTISGDVTNAINQLPDSSETGQASLKTLLTQLQEAIETDTDLPDPDKSDLLEQVQSLAEAKQTEEPTRREGMARRAMKMFDATLKSLPDTAKIVEACSKLLPLILKVLGIPA
jgi:uncharacterized protein YjbI with pentapeptide repeats